MSTAAISTQSHQRVYLVLANQSLRSRYISRCWHVIGCEQFAMDVRQPINEVLNKSDVST